MDVKFPDFFSPSSSSSWVSREPYRTCFASRHAVLHTSGWKHSRRKCLPCFVVVDGDRRSVGIFLNVVKRDGMMSPRTRKAGPSFPMASSNDGVTVNGSPQVDSRSEVEEMRRKFDLSLQGEDSNDGLVQSLHDAARVFELAIKEHYSQPKLAWFTSAWLGVDRTSWIKTLAYQASVYSLLQAASEISSRGSQGDGAISILIQKSLLRQSAPLESNIREKLSNKQSEVYEWFWSEPIPAAITSFVTALEKNSWISAANTVGGTGIPHPGKSSDISLVMLALTCIAAITKLGTAKVSCSQFFSMLPEITGKLMETLVDLQPIQQAYASIKKVGLKSEFLSHFGSRAASCRVRNDGDVEELIFWVNLVQKQLQRATDRERIWSRLTTSESIEVLVKDLAIFGFFIALGRRTQAFLTANGFDVVPDPLEGLIRFFIGGSVLYYPQLSSISSYQLYVEVVCEELDWLQFYPGLSNNQKQIHGHGDKPKGPPNAEAIPVVLEVCSHWILGFTKYSKWLKSPSNVKAAGFISRGHVMLVDCAEQFGLTKNEASEVNPRGWKAKSVEYMTTSRESDSFDKALESVEEAVVRLEELLQELHVSNSTSGKEHIQAACSDLEKIRRLMKEAEFLEASFRAKTASLHQEEDVGPSKSADAGPGQPSNRSHDKPVPERSKSYRGLWNFLLQQPKWKSNPDSSDTEKNEVQNEEIASQKNKKIGVVDPDSSGIRRFELLRSELIELEKRVQQTTYESEYVENLTDESSNGNDNVRDMLVPVEKKENIIEKSVVKLKETSRDVLQGTQLLAIDVVAAMGLLRRSVIGDELTEKEKMALKRTMTDLASVIPIGVLMLLPVTAVGHAAMLAAIQRYVPSLIPSTYGQERLGLLRQLEKVKEMDTVDEESDEQVEELA
ncbi:hypothetical protein MLD38_018540 [Melastoma candidum]|uniref:Uncharacterized protein n=1 Tax=Melastoma candidum TaxID=119954 RepID=A0ACB9QU57_9MYRT|nr:hypothetical protein MLD38_018540 [Melastoma candidum]